MKIVTWNVNSLRVRLAALQQWLALHQPDIVALQETKVINEQFPKAAFVEMGYHTVFSGQATYNGVAILSREPCTDIVTDIPNFEDAQRRILMSTTLGIRVVNLYVPNGGEIDSEKYHYKLAWLKHITHYLADMMKQHERVVVLGDFNIAPDERDVYDPIAWSNSVLFSIPERQAFQELLRVGLSDSFRCKHEEAGHYTWWDYRAAAFRRKQGLRIDHILINDSFAPTIIDCTIDKALRAAERPSDHVPVVLQVQEI